MPSPFPDKDPWLEAAGIGPDFHDGLVGEIRAVLNQSRPPFYYAQSGVREELGVSTNTSIRRIVPDVSLYHVASIDVTDKRSVADGPRTDVTDSIDVNVYYEPFEPNCA